jgi:hypothetical protein
LRILVGLKVRQYFNKNKEAIRIIEVSEKLEIAAAGQKNLLANGDKRVSRGMHLVLRKR